MFSLFFYFFIKDFNTITLSYHFTIFTTLWQICITFVYKRFIYFFVNYKISYMKDISIISPVKKPEDIEHFVNNTKCKHFYVYYHKFLDNFEYINKSIEDAKKNNSKIYINFKHNL